MIMNSRFYNFYSISFFLKKLVPLRKPLHAFWALHFGRVRGSCWEVTQAWKRICILVTYSRSQHYVVGGLEKQWKEPVSHILKNHSFKYCVLV